MPRLSLIRLPSLQAVLLFLMALIIYSGSLSAPIVFDDEYFFTDLTQIEKYRHAYLGLELRWLSNGSLSWMLAWLGPDLRWERLGNVLLHASNAIALLFFLRRLFQITLRDDDSTAMPDALPWLAFFGALIFMLHPVAVYGVAYLIQRSTLMATTFSLLMLLAYLEGLAREKQRWMLLAALCYFAAVYSKEHSVAIPGVALALTFLVRTPSVRLLRQITPFYLLAILIAAAVTWSTMSGKGGLGSAYEPNAGGMLSQAAKIQGLSDLPHAHLLSMLTQSYLFFKYLWLWLIPNPGWMSVDMRESFATSFLSWPQSLGLVAFPAYFFLSVWMLLKRGRTGLLGFAMLFPWILFLTEGATVRIQEPFVLYRSYLWMPGLFAALPAVLGWLRDKRLLSVPAAVADCGQGRPTDRRTRTTLLVLGAACLICVPLTLNRLQTFSSALLLWDDAEKLVRGKHYMLGVERIYYNRGTEFGHLNRLQEAISDFGKSINANPNVDFAYGNRATAYYLLGEYQLALQDYDRAISLNPNNPNSYHGRALTHRSLGNLHEEQDDFQRSCALGGACQ